MIKVSVFYPFDAADDFNHAYYVSEHMPMVQRKLGAALKGTAVEQGVAGATPGSSPTYAAMCHLLFDTVEDFESSFGPHAADILADIPNYTRVQPVLQISQVRM